MDKPTSKLHISKILAEPLYRGEPDFEQVDPELNLPSSHLYLREFGGESLVLAKQHLKAGTVLGTYKGYVRDPDTEDNNSLLKVNRSDGGSPVHVMLEDDGHWLKLMRTALLPTEANICLRISGADILCTVTKDVNKEVELKVTCRIVDKEKDAQQFDEIELKPKNLFKEICELESVKDESNDSDIEQKDCKNSEKMLDLAPEVIGCSRRDMSSKHSIRDNEHELDVKKMRIESYEDTKDKHDEVSSSTVHRSPSSGKYND
ncbi:uncharacterized protein TNCV_4872181 [Trichonephila clavipes]|nr:uncharacterized protein TNCV_4872181 [Trichonephila clavipes]